MNRDSVITLDQAVEDQKHLDRLCTKDSRASAEISISNDMYSHGTIIKDYAGIPYHRPLKVVIPHGPDFTDFIWDYERDIALPVILAHSPNRERVYLERTRKKVIRTAFPYLYLLELLKDHPAPERNGSLFFPAHSMENLPLEADFSEQAEGLLRLDSRFHPITVCIYWLDYLHGHHRPFEERGFRIVSAGAATNSAFLARTHHLLSLHKYALSSERGSYMHYAIASGCSFHFCGAEWKYRWIFPSDEVRHKVTAQITAEHESRLRELFSIDDPAPFDKQKTWADYYLGRSWFHSPKELRKILAHAERLDKFGFIIGNSGYSRRWVVPPFIKRTYWSTRRKIRRIAGRT